MQYPGANYVFRDEFNLSPTIDAPCGEDTVFQRIRIIEDSDAPFRSSISIRRYSSTIQPTQAALVSSHRTPLMLGSLRYHTLLVIPYRLSRRSIPDFQLSMAYLYFLILFLLGFLRDLYYRKWMWLSWRVTASFHLHCCKIIEFKAVRMKEKSKRPVAGGLISGANNDGIWIGQSLAFRRDSFVNQSSFDEDVLVRDMNTLWTHYEI